MRAGAIGAGSLVTAVVLMGCASVPQPDLATPDPSLIALGRDAFSQCDGCHSLDPQGRSGMGPSLFGIAGRKAGGWDGYPYSVALAESGVTWDAASLDAFLADPSGFIPGSEMKRGTVHDPDLRAAIVAYLVSASE
jgi:cytochrome c